MIAIDTEWILKRFGINVDPELAELATLLSMRFKNATDKKQFVKDALRAALGGASNVVNRER